MISLKEYLSLCKDKISFLNEYILQELFPNIPLYEQAVPRSEFILKLMSLATPILSHWGLIEYAHGDFEGTDSYEQYVEHWKDELSTFCDDLCQNKIKRGDRKKAIQHAIINKAELNDQSEIYNRIKKKFNKENISLEDTKKIAKYLSDNIDDLIEALSNVSYDEWIETL